MANEGKRGAHALVKFKESPGAGLLGLVTLNNISNILGALILGGMAVKLFPEDKQYLFSGIFTITVILLSEIFPKLLGTWFPEFFGLVFARPLLWIGWPFRPLNKILTKLGQLVKKSEPVYTEDMLRTMADEAEAEGQVKKEIGEMIDEVLDLADSTVKDRGVLVSLKEVTYLDEKSLEVKKFGSEPKPLKEVLCDQSFRYSRLPVGDEQLNKISYLKAQSFF